MTLLGAGVGDQMGGGVGDRWVPYQGVAVWESSGTSGVKDLPPRGWAGGHTICLYTIYYLHSQDRHSSTGLIEPAPAFHSPLEIQLDLDRRKHHQHECYRPDDD